MAAVFRAKKEIPASVERWLNEHWVPAALCMAIALTLLVPLMVLHWGLARLLTYAMLPVCMFHQVEEHTGDRFRIFVNEKVFGGVEALSHDSVLWISLPGVWGVGLLSVYAATFVGPGWGLSMVCLVLVNSVAHLVGSGCVAPIQSRILDNPSPLHPGRHLGAGENFQRVRRGPDTPCRWHGCGHRNPCRHCYLYEAAESKNCGTRQIHGVSVARAKIRGFLASS
jgi:Protein of unknown function with HXXEE motif